MRTLYSCLFVLCCSLWMNLADAAIVRLNPGDSIQAAINAAADGDTIELTKGVYQENLEIINKDITIKGAEDGVIIQLSSAGELFGPFGGRLDDLAVILFINILNKNVTFENLTLAGKRIARPGVDIFSSGIESEDANLTLKRVTMIGFNDAMTHSGGDLNIEDSNIVYNDANKDGGSTLFASDNIVNITNSKFLRNGLTGMFLCQSGGKTNIRSSTFAFNQSQRKVTNDSSFIDIFSCDDFVMEDNIAFGNGSILSVDAGGLDQSFRTFAAANAAIKANLPKAIFNNNKDQNPGIAALRLSQRSFDKKFKKASASANALENFVNKLNFAGGGKVKPPKLKPIKLPGVKILPNKDDPSLFALNPDGKSFNIDSTIEPDRDKEIFVGKLNKAFIVKITNNGTKNVVFSVVKRPENTNVDTPIAVGETGEIQVPAGEILLKILRVDEPEGFNVNFDVEITDIDGNLVNDIDDFIGNEFNLTGTFDGFDSPEFINITIKNPVRLVVTPVDAEFDIDMFFKKVSTKKQIDPTIDGDDLIFDLDKKGLYIFRLTPDVADDDYEINIDVQAIP